MSTYDERYLLIFYIRSIIVKTIQTDKAPAALGPYSQAKVSGGFLFASGQIGINPEDGIVVTGLEAQTKQVIKNIDAVLTAAGTDVSKVIKTTCFLANMSDFQAFNAIYGEYFTSKPARSCVAVKDLPLGVLCEVEIIAEI